MKHDPLSRYDTLEDGTYVVNIRAKSPGSLFNEFDFDSSLWNIDLRKDFVDYLVDCVDEIGDKNNFVLQVCLPEDKIEKGFAGKFGKAINSYFFYLIHISKKSILRLTNKIIFNFILSLSLLVLILLIGKNINDTESMIYMIFNEGLYIAIWVLMWPVFSDFLIEMKGEWDKLKIYKRFLDIELLFDSYKDL